VTGKTIKNLLDEKLLIPSNILRVLGIVSGRVFTGPLKVLVDITAKCDMGCAMCWYHSPYLDEARPSLPDMPLEKFKDLIKEFRRLHVKIVTFCGEGEPLLHSRIEEMIEFVRKNSMEAEIFTNGLYLGRERIDYFRKIGLKKILISLHAADADTFTRIRPSRTREDFQKIMSNLLYLAQVRSSHNRPQLFIINVISHINHQNVLGMIKLAKDLEADKILFKPLTLPLNSAQYLRLSESDIKNIIGSLSPGSSRTTVANNIRDYVEALKNYLHSEGKPKSPKSFIFPFKCYLPWVYSEVGLDGKVIGCLYADGRLEQGNIYKSSFFDIWYNRRYNDFRNGSFCPEHCLGKAVYPLLV
jgi:GTP 3',8-cyclase